MIIEEPYGRDVTALLARSDAYSASLYPPESRHQAGSASLTGPAVCFLVAGSDGIAVGCGALVIATDGTGELQRMFVSAAPRGRGIGRKLLKLLRSTEAAAEAEAVRLLRLETGIHNEEKLRLYRRLGYVERGPFGGYPADPLTIFMEKPLA